MAQYNEAEVIAAMEAGKFTRRSLYIENHESFGRFILSDQVRDPVARVAHDIAHLAGEFSPRRKARGRVPDDATTLANSFKVKVEAGVIKVDRALRVKVEVYNSQKAAAPMEFGNAHVGRGHRMLGRAGAVYGDFHSGERDLP